MAREDWWGYVKRVIQAYPMLRDRCERIGLTDGLTGREQRRYDAVHRAIAQTARMDNGRARLQLIDRVYFQRSHTLYGAAREAAIGERTARRWNAAFVRLVAEQLDLP